MCRRNVNTLHLTHRCYMNLELCINNACFTIQIHSLSDNERSNISCTNQNIRSSLITMNRIDYLHSLRQIQRNINERNPILIKSIWGINDQHFQRAFSFCHCASGPQHALISHFVLQKSKLFRHFKEIFISVCVMIWVVQNFEFRNRLFGL